MGKKLADSRKTGTNSLKSNSGLLIMSHLLYRSAVNNSGLNNCFLLSIFYWR